MPDGLRAHASWMVSGGVLQAATSFIGNLVLVRFLLPGHFGVFALVLGTTGVVGTSINLRLHDILVRESADELDGDRRDLYLSVLLVQAAALGLLATLALWLVGLWGLFAAILVTSQVASIIINAQGRLYERSLDYQGVALYETVAHISGHVFAATGAVVGLGPIVLYAKEWVRVLGQLFGLGLLDGLTAFRLRRPSLADWRLIATKVRGFWTDGWLEQAFDHVLILSVGALAGTTITGYFYQAQLLAATPHRILQPATFRVTFNIFSRRIEDGRRRGLPRLLGLEAALLAPLALVGFVLADPVIPFVFGPGWDPVVPLFRAMTGVVLALTLFNTFKAYFMSEDRMLPFILGGRGAQYGAIGLAVAVVLLLGLEPGRTLALGLSGSYLLGVSALGGILLLYLGRRRPEGASRGPG